MKQYPVFMSDAADLSNGLDRAHLVIGVHHRDQDSPPGNSLSYIIGTDPSEAVHRQERHFSSHLFYETAWRNHRRVLDLGRDDVIAMVTQSEKGAPNCMVVRFGTPARENDLVRLATNQSRNLCASFFDRLFCGRSCPMTTGGVAIVVCQEGPHGIAHLRGDRRTRVVIEVYSSYSKHLSEIITNRQIHVIVLFELAKGGPIPLSPENVRSKRSGQIVRELVRHLRLEEIIVIRGAVETHHGQLPRLVFQQLVDTKRDDVLVFLLYRKSGR